MKSNIIKSILLGVLVFGGLSSCEPEMDYANPTAPSDANYYNTKEHLIYAVNGAYNILQRGGGWARCMPFVLNARSDEYSFTSGAAAGEPTSANMSAYAVSSDNEFLTLAYRDLYVMQYAANLAIEKLEANQDNAFNLDNSEDKALHNRLMGEALFLRGLSRFYLAFNWGDQIPDRNYVSTGGSDLTLGPAAPGEVYKNMIADFQQAAELLPNRSTIYANGDDVGRATKGSALAFLAKAYLGRPILDGTANAGSADWSAAKAVLKQIIDSGEYQLVNNYRDNGSEDNENNSESLFEVQFSQSLDTNGFNPVADGDIGSWTISGQNTWRQIELSAPNSSESGRWWNGMPSLAIYNEFERDEAGNIIDPRAYQGMWIPDGAKYKGQSGSWLTYDQLFSGGTFNEWKGKWFGSRKYGQDYFVSDASRSGINDRLLRYADVLLMYAECCVETGDDNSALYYINLVRNRANRQMVNPTEADADMFYAKGKGNLPTAEEVLAEAPTLGKVTTSNGTVIIPGTKINTIRRLIKHEYSVELYWEGWRFFNLMRWHNNPNDPDASIILDNLVNKNSVQVAQTGLTGTVPFNYSTHLRLPIPAQELTTNPNMIGNEAN
ncbi:RagB/SusD family nutrient uptake outer membrane protein [Daejeonia sp. YH14]|uniref:RagB/SusD family nutrient uptake outer membrane protein n=1 Tax=Daejeonia sp. YH14 TaxID=3439042 RepID=UPI003F497018